MYELALTHAVKEAATTVIQPGMTNIGLVSSEPSLTGHLIRYAQKVYEYVVLVPLARLYLHGPSLGGWGFWNGLDLSVICSQKTNLLPEFWKSHPTECIQLVSKGFYGVLVLLETVTYFLLIWVILRCVANLCKRWGQQKKDPTVCSCHHKPISPNHDIVDHGHGESA